MVGRPRQSKSISHQDPVISSARAGSPSNVSTNSDTAASAQPKSRVSSDSSSNVHSMSGIPAQQPPAYRNSVEKSRAKKIFGRTSVDRDTSQLVQTEQPAPHKRTGSSFSDMTRIASSSQDDRSEAIDPVYLAVEFPFPTPSNIYL